MKEVDKIKIELTPYEVSKILARYFSGGKHYKISINEEFSLNNNQLDIKYYLVEHINTDGIKKDNIAELTNEDIEKALADFLDIYNFSLINYDYISTVTNEVLNYDGIKVIVKPKAKKLSRRQWTYDR